MIWAGTAGTESNTLWGANTFACLGRAIKGQLKLNILLLMLIANFLQTVWQHTFYSFYLFAFKAKANSGNDVRTPVQNWYLLDAKNK